jgi:hypothetical protein
VKKVNLINSFEEVNKTQSAVGMECEQTNTTSAQKVFPNSNPVAKQESLSF